MKPYEMNEVYEISETYRGVIAAIEAEECTADAMAEALAIIEDEFESKIDAVVCLKKNIKPTQSPKKREEHAIKKRLNTTEERAEWLESCLAETLLQNGKKKLETPRNKLSFRPSVSVFIDDELELKAMHPELTNVKTVVTPDKNAIKAALKKGVKISGAYLVEKQNLQIK